MTNLLRKKYDMMLATLSSGGAPRPYYTELEYLESTGTQYIDTGRIPNNTDIIEQKFCKKGSDSSVIAWYGSMPSSSTTIPRIAIGQFEPSGLSKKFYVGVNTTAQVANADNEVHTLRFYASSSTEITYIFDGVESIGQVISPNNAYSPELQLTSYLFARHGTNGVQVYDGSGTKIYYHKEFLSNGTLVLDLIPVLDWNYVPCMYDRVTKQLFYNQGTNDFIAGREIHEVEYIESTGTQYIDTGFIPTTATTASVSFTLISKLEANYPAPMYCGNAYNAGNTYGFSYNVSAHCFNAYRGSKINVHVGSYLDYNIFYNVTLSPTLITVKDVNGSTLGSADMDGTYQVGERSLYLFTGNTATTDLTGIADMKIYACQIWDNDILVRDFIPIVDENFNGYLFDKVNRKIYENAGTGSFGVPDIEVEYIESTGTQYFNTGYTQTQNTGLSVDCAFTDLSVGRFGCVKLVSGGTHRFYFGVLNNKWIGAANSINPNHDIATADYDRHQFDLNATGLYIDGELKVAPSDSFPLATIGLFNLINATVPVIASAKLYGSSIKENNEVVRNYIPVIHNGVACLKNTISNTYLINAGTGDFSAGKIVEKA